MGGNSLPFSCYHIQPMEFLDCSAIPPYFHLNPFFPCLLDLPLPLASVELLKERLWIFWKRQFMLNRMNGSLEKPILSSNIATDLYVFNIGLGSLIQKKTY